MTTAAPPRLGVSACTKEEPVSPPNTARRRRVAEFSLRTSASRRVLKKSLSLHQIQHGGAGSLSFPSHVSHATRYHRVDCTLGKRQQIPTHFCQHAMTGIVEMSHVRSQQCPRSCVTACRPINLTDVSVLPACSLLLGFQQRAPQATPLPPGLHAGLDGVRRSSAATLQRYTDAPTTYPQMPAPDRATPA